MYVTSLASSMSVQDHFFFLDALCVYRILSTLLQLSLNC